MGAGPTTLEELRVALAAGVRDFPGLRLGGIDAQDLHLAHCHLQGSCFKEARFGRASLRQAQVQECHFQQALLWGSDLSGLQAQGSFWHDADLSGSRLQEAVFDHALMHRCCLRGVLAASSRWQEARMVEADFRSGLDQLTDLGGADFTRADLSFAQLEGANLNGATLQGSCLYGANLRGCDLRQANLLGCDLRDTQLEGALMEGAQRD